MSLYNALFGVNPYADTLLHMLAIDQGHVPRFRDCYLDEEGRIVIYTRTGGGNRAAYEKGGEDVEDYNPTGPYNDDLRELPGFIKDEDDEFDCTYARFFYQPPQALADIIAEIREKQGARDPSEAFHQLIADLKANKETAATKRALEVGEEIFKNLEKGGARVIKI